MPMTLSELTDIVTRITGKTDNASLSLCKDMMRRRYRMIYDSAAWRESELILSISVAANTTEVIVPHTMERVKAARWNSETIVWPVEFSALLEKDPSVFERVGTPTAITELATVGVHTAPGGKAITLVSSSAADTAMVVSVRGEVGTTEKQETITLNGTTSVSGTLLWDRILMLGKPVTAGTVTVTNSSGTTLLELWPTERTRQHVRLNLHEIPSEAKTLMLFGKRRIRELTNDADAPILRNIDNALMAYVQADMLEYARQYDKAAAKQQEGHAHLALMRNLDSEQGGRISQIIPASSGEYSRNDLSGGGGSWLFD